MNITWWFYPTGKTYERTTDIEGALEEVRCQMSRGSNLEILRGYGYGLMIKMVVPCVSAPGLEAVYYFSGTRREKKKFIKELRNNGWA